MRLSEAASLAATRTEQVLDILLEVLGEAENGGEDELLTDLRLIYSRLSNIYDDLEDISLE